MQPAAVKEAQDYDVKYVLVPALTSNAAIDPECVENSQCQQCWDDIYKFKCVVRKRKWKSHLKIASPHFVSCYLLFLFPLLHFKWMIISSAPMAYVKLSCLINVFLLRICGRWWCNRLRWGVGKWLRLRHRRFDMNNMIETIVIALMMFTRQCVIVRMLFFVSLLNILNALMLRALWLLLPLIVRCLFGIVKLRFPLRRECQTTATFCHIL